MKNIWETQTMSRIIRVTLEFDDIVKIAEGEEATKFEKNLHSLVVHAHENEVDPFGKNTIKWKTYKKEE